MVCWGAQTFVCSLIQRGQQVFYTKVEDKPTFHCGQSSYLKLLLIRHLKKLKLGIHILFELVCIKLMKIFKHVGFPLFFKHYTLLKMFIMSNCCWISRHINFVLSSCRFWQNVIPKYFVFFVGLGNRKSWLVLFWMPFAWRGVDMWPVFSCVSFQVFVWWVQA